MDGICRGYGDLSFESAADEFIAPGFLEGLENLVADRPECDPIAGLGTGLDLRSGAQNLGIPRELCQVNALDAFPHFRERTPDLITSEAHDGSQQPDQRFADSPDGGLGATPCLRFGRENVKAILQYVKIESAQVHNAEIIYSMVNLVEGELSIPVANL